MFTFIHPETTITMTDDLSSVFGTEEKQNWTTEWLEHVQYMIALIEDQAEDPTWFTSVIRTTAHLLLEEDVTREEVEAFVDRYSAYDLDHLEDYIEACNELDEDVVHAYIDEQGDVAYAESVLEAYQGQYESMEDFARQMVDDCGDLQDVPHFIENAIDWEVIAEQFHWDYNITIDGYVFNNNV